ncbi:MAG: hypothetical protein M9894_08565 [Planctomycetes bacterium]|nr:hypothetical protein [Planctomycetota bacterium]
MTALAWVVALGLPVALAWALVRCLDPGCPRWLAVGLAAALGPAAGSLLHVGWLAAFGAPGAGALAVEVALLGGALALARRRSAPGGDDDQGARPGWSALDRGLAAVVAAAALMAVVHLAALTAAAPHGNRDAWAVWNQRARALARSDGDWARVLVGPPRPDLHLDYPLAVPGAVARVWWLTGESTLAPALLALQAALAGAAVVGLGLASARPRAVGLLGAALVLSAPLWAREAASQCADVPLAALLGATAALLVRVERAPRPGAFAALGAAAGLAAWTKNEGLVALAGVVPAAALLAGAGGRARAAGLALLGAAPALLALGLHKAVAPTNDLVGAQGADTPARLLDPGRWGAVVTGLGGAALHLWPAAALVGWAALVGLRPPPRPRAARALGALLVLQVAAYVLAYVTTPWDLAWHLQTSRARVLLHLWPAGVLLALLAAGAAERDAPPSPAEAR